MPERIVVPQVFENPSLNRSQFQEFKRETSLQNIHQSSMSHLDVSRVKTVAIREREQHPQQHFPSASSLDRPVETLNPIRASFAQTTPSPKITFNIRSTLPTRVNQVSPFEEIQRKVIVQQPLPQSRVVIPQKAPILPPQQHIEMRKV